MIYLWGLNNVNVERTNLTSLPRSNIVGLVGIECGYGNDLELFPALADPAPTGARPLIA